MSNLTANIDGASGVSRLRRYAPVAILIGAGIALSILAFIIAQKWERGRVEFDFRESPKEGYLMLRHSGRIAARNHQVWSEELQVEAVI